MAKLLLYIVCIITYTTVAAQSTQRVDSLLRSITTATDDSTLLNLYRQVGEYYMDNNPKKAITYFNNAIPLATSLNKSTALANSHYSLGFSYLMLGKYPESLESYLKSTRIYEANKDNRRLVNAYLSIANVYAQANNKAKRNEYYNKAEALNLLSTDSFQLSNIYSERGTMYDQSGNYDSALLFQRKALHISSLLNDDFGIAGSYTNLGLIHKHKYEGNKAIVLFDSALYYYNKTNDIPIDVYAAVYNNIGATQSLLGKYNEAEASFAKSISYSIQANNRSNEMENYKNLASMYAQKRDYKKQAYYLTKYYNIKDSLNNTNTKNELTQLETDYQLEKKNTEIERNKVKIAQQKNQRNILIIIASTALIVLGGLYYFYKKIQKSNKKINAQKTELLQLNQVKDRLFSVLGHDLRNPLVTLHTYLALTEQDTLPQEQKQAYRLQTYQAVLQTSATLDNLLLWANMQIKNTPLTLVPVYLQDVLSDAVADVAAQAKQKQLTILQPITTVNVISDYNSLLIALRNILTNAVKYSTYNTSIHIAVKDVLNATVISIKDAGCGIPPEQIQAILQKNALTTAGTLGEKGSGLGLILVQDILHKLGTTLLIESNETQGTTCSIMLPKVVV